MSATDGPSPAGIGSYRSAVRFDPERPVVANVASHRATTVFVVCLEVGQELSEHLAPGELTLLIIEGQPTVTVGAVTKVTATGDVVVMAAGTPHSLSVGACRAVVVASSKPYRDLANPGVWSPIAVRISPGSAVTWAGTSQACAMKSPPSLNCYEQVANRHTDLPSKPFCSSGREVPDRGASRPRRAHPPLRLGCRIRPVTSVTGSVRAEDLLSVAPVPGGVPWLSQRGERCVTHTKAMIEQSLPAFAPIGALTEIGVGFTAILSEHDGEKVIVVSGDVSGSAASALASVMVGLDGGDDQVVIDLSSVTSIDSAGVTVLLQEHGRLVGEGRTLILEAPSPPAQEVLDRMGMNDIVTIRPAVSAVRARLVVVADG